MKRTSVFVLLASLMMLLGMTAIVSADDAVDGCTNAWTYHMNESGDYNVSIGNVCVDSTDYDVDPTAGVNCGTWSDCVADACSADEYYVGYLGDGTETCDATGWVSAGTTYDVADNYIIDTTEAVDTCSVTNTGKTATYDACTNLYTRQGPDGYCDGAGALDTNDASLHVADGKVCVAGANTAPNATVKCGTWYDCVADATDYDHYYVGYAASGTLCSDTSWVSSGTTTTLATGLRVKYTEHTDTVCSTAGYNPAYNKADFEPIVTDGLGTAGASVVSWVDLLVLLGVLVLIGGLVIKLKR
jgi:hypothetical protein